MNAMMHRKHDIAMLEVRDGLRLPQAVPLTMISRLVKT